MFPTKEKSEVIQNVKGFKAILKAKRPVTVETEEKLLGILYLIKNHKAEIIDLAPTDPKTNNIIDGVIVISFKLSEYAKLFNSHNYDNLLQELNKLQGLTIKYEYPNKKGFWVTSPVLSYHYFQHTGEIRLKMEKAFLELCNRYALYLNFEVYTKLNKLEKNIYKILVSNSGKKQISIQTLKERSLTEISTIKNFKIKLKKCIKKLIQLKVLKSAEIKKDYLHYSFIDKNTNTQDNLITIIP